jgi:hypothetical protein
MKLQLVINFEDLDDLKAFIEDQETIELIKQKKMYKKQHASDKRGHQTKSLHQKAREYQNANPTLTYKEALQIIGKQVRENKLLCAESQTEIEGKTTDEEDSVPEIIIGRIIEKVKKRTEKETTI